jgi:drug/metabolite transporter (DMT)-like permease
MNLLPLVTGFFFMLAVAAFGLGAVLLVMGDDFFDRTPGILLLIAGGVFSGVSIVAAKK